MNFPTIVNELREEAYERGYSWAHARAATSMSDADREFLENDARGLTTRLHATPFDPKVNPEDQLVHERYKQRLRDLDDADMVSAKANVEIRRCEQDLADHVLPEQPRASTIGTICGTALFAIGFAIGFYDWIYERVGDPYLAGLIALAGGTALGLFLTSTIYNTKSPTKRTRGVAAGLALSLSAGFLRYAFSGGLFIAASLTLFELAIVGVLDWRGRHLNDEFEKWSGDQKENARRRQWLDLAQQVGTRAAERVQELREQTAGHLEMIAARSLCCQKLPDIEEALKTAEVTGAQRGIAENLGIKRGVLPINSAAKGVRL